MNDSKLDDGRKIFVWQGHDVTEATCRLTAAVAEACAAEIFVMDGKLVSFNDGEPAPLTRASAIELIGKFIAGIRLVRGGENWEREFFPYRFPPTTDPSKQPTEMVLMHVLDGLKPLVAKGPRTPVACSEQQLFEIKQRLDMGEPASVVSDYYKIDPHQLETIRRMAKA